MKGLVLVFLLLSINVFAQQKVVGTVTDEEFNPLPAVLVVNINLGIKTATDSSGKFEIPAKASDELRFVRNGYERGSLITTGNVANVRLFRSAVAIEEVEIEKVRLSGNIERDAASLQKTDKVENLQKEIGVPKAPEKPREKPAELTEDVLKPLLSLQIKPQAIYDIISGDSRRKKSLYRFEDLQDNIRWIRTKLDDEYFTKAGIPQGKIDEFLEFSLRENDEIASSVEVNNLSKVLLMMEDLLPIYLNRIKS